MKLSHLSVAVFSAIALAACGGGSDNAVDNSHKDSKKETKKEEVKPTVPAIVADQLKAKPSSLWNAEQLVDRTLEINGKETKVLAVNPYDVAGNNKYGYVQNSKLLKEGKTTDANNIYAKKADGNFALVKQGTGEAAGMVFASDAADVTDPKKALKAADVYQKPSPGGDEGSYLTKIAAFGSDYTITNKESFPEEINFDKLEAGKVVDGKIVYTVHTQVAQLDSDGQEILDADGQATMLNIAQDVPTQGYKAYKQAYSSVVLHTDLDHKQVISSHLVDGAGLHGGLTVVGVQSLGLPDTGSAVYKGKAFTTKSTADLKLDVQFGKDKYLVAADITNRTSNADGKALSSLKSNPATRDNDQSIELALEAVDNSASPEYDRLIGDFYGTKAEEVAGGLYKGNVDPEDPSKNPPVGAFAASSK